MWMNETEDRFGNLQMYSVFYCPWCKTNDSLTDNEVKIMSFLVKDREIQEALEVGKSL